MEFLFCEKLAEKIRELCLEAEQRIYACSPYVGRGWSKFLCREEWDSLDLRVIVDFSKPTVSLGSTNPWSVQELKEIGEIRNQEKLHAKLYIFDDKAIVCSANLSQRAFEVNIEAGVLIEDRNVVNQIAESFAKIWESSDEIRDGDISDREQIWDQSREIREQMRLEDFEDVAISDPDNVRDAVLEILRRQGHQIDELPGQSGVFLLNDHLPVYTLFSQFHERGVDYWFGIPEKKLNELRDMGSFFILFICGGRENVIIIPSEEMTRILEGVAPTGVNQQWRIAIYSGRGRFELKVTGKARIDLTKYRNNYDLIPLPERD